MPSATNGPSTVKLQSQAVEKTDRTENKATKLIAINTKLWRTVTLKPLLLWYYIISDAEPVQTQTLDRAEKASKDLDATPLDTLFSNNQHDVKN